MAQLRRFITLFLLATVSCGSSNEDLSGPTPTPPDAGTGGSGGSEDASTGGQGGVSAGAGGGTAGEGGSPLSAQDACQQFSTQLCDQYEVCAPTLIDATYGDATTCASRTTEACVKALALPDTVKTPQWTATCGDALAAISCEEFMTRSIPAVCTSSPGPRPEGSGCGEDGQCATSYCAVGADDACGTCTTKADAGGSCEKDDDCSGGLVCASNRVCVAPAQQGESCDPNHPCAAWLSCVGAVQGTCSPVAGPGEACQATPLTQPGCDLLHGLFCNLLSGNCEDMTVAQPGERCGLLANGYAICGSGGTCRAIGTCLAAAPDGEACNSVVGPSCFPPAACVGDVCVLRDPSACPQ